MYVVKVTDGLGNQMFQYAFAKKLQMVTEKKVYLDTRYINHEDMVERGAESHFISQCGFRQYGLNHFKTKLPIADNRVLCRWEYLKQRNLYENIVFQLAQNNIWFWKYINEANSSNIIQQENVKNSTYVEGFFFDIKCYDDIKHFLQKDFRLVEKIHLPRELKYILQNENTVSLHIRKGDFTYLSRDISEKPYYSNAIKWVEKNIEKPFYLVFSDDIKWVKRNIPLAEQKLYVSDMRFADYEELTIMKHCKHNIIANSTFSYWAAYLNSHEDKKVICPKNWRKSIIPKEWIEL